MIAFLGSVFSPYYALARRWPPARALNHCAFNVVLSGRRDGRWAMTERGAADVRRDAHALLIGASSMRWDGSTLQIDLHERCAPLPRPLRGTLRIQPTGWSGQGFALDPAGKHVWVPLAPTARVEVAFSNPALRWSGNGYLDSNRGIEPLEAAFSRWTWSRMAAGNGKTIVLYDVLERDRTSASLALEFASSGALTSIPAPPPCQLPTSGWRIARQTRADSGQRVRVLETLLDAPFYARSLLETRIAGTPGRAVHESLDLERFRSAWVQCLLPFRMPRVRRARISRS